MAQALTFAPGHITGFFSIWDAPEDPLQKGSRGAGICFKQGIRTRVRIKPASQNSIAIYMNGKKTNSALVSLAVASSFLAKMQKRYYVEVEHEVKIPIGCGLGASGAGALSLAMALNKLLLRAKNDLTASQIAHIAEIKYKTGLGTVIAQNQGGLEIRKQPGGPGFGEIDSLIVKPDYRVICLVLKKMPTQKMLSNRKIRERINEYGEKALKRFLVKPAVNKFMTIARDFAEAVGLISPRLRKIIDLTDKKGFLCSQAMFGETLFSIVKRADAAKLIEIFSQSAPKSHWLINKEIDNEGARLL